MRKNTHTELYMSSPPTAAGLADSPPIGPPDVFPSFSRDGKWIYFSSTRTGTPSVWKIPASGGDAVQVSPTPGLLALESIDGAHLYYVESMTTDAPGPLWRLPLHGGAPRQAGGGC